MRAAQLYLFLTYEPEGGRWSTLCPGHLTPGKENWYLLYRRLDEPWGWPEHVQKISPPPGLEPPSTQPIVYHYTSYANAASTLMVSSQKKKRPEWVNIYESMAANNELVKPT